MTIIVHHLNQSRSHRILWLLEELEVPYEIKEYKRNRETMMAPPELKHVHPLGKSPVLENTETNEIIAESGAIVEVPSSQPTTPIVEWDIQACHHCIENVGLADCSMSLRDSGREG